MKKFLLVLVILGLLFVPVKVFAASDVTVGWTITVVEPDVLGFKVYRTQNQAVWPSSPIATLADPGARDYVDSGLTDGTYYYRVAAYDASQEGSPGEGSVTVDQVPGGKITVTISVTVTP